MTQEPEGVCRPPLVRFLHIRTSLSGSFRRGVAPNDLSDLRLASPRSLQGGGALFSRLTTGRPIRRNQRASKNPDQPVACSPVDPMMSRVTVLVKTESGLYFPL